MTYISDDWSPSPLEQEVIDEYIAVGPGTMAKAKVLRDEPSMGLTERETNSDENASFKIRCAQDIYDDSLTIVSGHLGEPPFFLTTNPLSELHSYDIVVQLEFACLGDTPASVVNLMYHQRLQRRADFLVKAPRYHERSASDYWVMVTYPELLQCPLSDGMWIIATVGPVHDCVTIFLHLRNRVPTSRNQWITTAYCDRPVDLSRYTKMYRTIRWMSPSDAPEDLRREMERAPADFTERDMGFIVGEIISCNHKP